MPTPTLTTELINTIIERQLDRWQEARDNFFRLGEAERRKMSWGDLQGAIQLNPARIRSTGAATDARSVAARPCFLCEANRPAEQDVFEWPEGWDFLVNPYPILPVHFTVVSRIHRPQDRIPLDMATMAESAPDLAFFFNGARAGASAPDHMHVQAVLKNELPLLRLAESYHPAQQGGAVSSEEFGIRLPFHFISAVITPDDNGFGTLARIPGAYGIDADTGRPERGLVNAFFWIGNENILRCIIVPRRRHRPSCFYETGDRQFIISPGAIDMSGLVVVPRIDDFKRLDDTKVSEIYSEVAFQDRLPEEIKQHFAI